MLSHTVSMVCLITDVGFVTPLLLVIDSWGVFALVCLLILRPDTLVQRVASPTRRCFEFDVALLSRCYFPKLSSFSEPPVEVLEELS